MIGRGVPVMCSRLVYQYGLAHEFWFEKSHLYIISISRDIFNRINLKAASRAALLILRLSPITAPLSDCFTHGTIGSVMEA